MTAVSTRDALADALAGLQVMGIRTGSDGSQMPLASSEVADALFASGAVVDAATLTDNEKLVSHVALLASGVPQTGRDIERANLHLRALAAALTECAAHA